MDLFTRVQFQGNLGFNAKQPTALGSIPTPPGTIHDTYSIDGNPSSTRIVGINGVKTLPNPSILDLGTLTPITYMSNPPR